jgi:hypothetical protein
MKMDHHCPWVNNCIGQFTQKFFILFCFYSLLACLEVLTIEFYYGHYKSRTLFIGKLKTTGICIQILFNIIFLIFSFIMLRDQWGIIQNDSTMIDLKKKRFEEKYHMKTTRCINCFVIRPINAHHCTVCHKCILEQDHHCPWVNNCIGLYNKKAFILFLCYGFLESFYSDILFFYYTLYKNINKWSNSPKLIILDILAIIFGLILIIVSIMLLWDQYDSIVNDCTQCDYKRGILLEKSSIKQQFQMIFGGIFNFRWLLPFFPGGNSDFFGQLSNFLKYRNSMKNKNKMENNDIKQNNSDDKFKNE